ncbi:MAG: hypothetical protein RLZZ360_936 [Candidatus Parcubacteria bacterium]|jgi:hypothetical protein
MSMTTTQPAMATSAKTRERRIFKGVRMFFEPRSRHEHPTVLSYEQSVKEITKALGCNCGGRCQGCRHIISDVLGD